MKTTKKKKNWLLPIATIIVIFIVLVPIVNVIIQSFMSNEQSVTSTLIPLPPSLDGYRALVGSDLFIPFLRTLVIAVVGTILAVSLMLLASFAISRDDFKYKKITLFLLFIFMTVPASSLIVSRFVLIKNAGLLNTYISLIIAGLFSTSSIFIMQGYMKKIPESLIEMCIVNGGSFKNVFFDIVVPMVKPGIVIISLLSFLGYYNMYTEPLMFITDPNKQTFQIALREVIGDTGASASTVILPNAEMAAIVISLLVVAVLLPLMHRYYIKGLTDGGVK